MITAALLALLFLPPNPQSAPGGDGVLDRLAIRGDFRFREEADFGLAARPSRNRQRLRFRLAAAYEARSDILVAGRLVTGDRRDPRSSHVTLGDGLQDLEISLDRLYLEYSPASLDGLRLQAGKMAHPFQVNPVYGELAWDADVQPEGVTAVWDRRWPGRLRRLRLAGGQYALLEQSTAGEAWLTALQGVAALDAGADTSLELALGAQVYTDPTPGGSTVLLGRAAGNALVDRDGDGQPDHFRSDFAILQPGVSVARVAAGVPWVLSLESFHNLRARGGEDTGWAAGVSAGWLKEPGDWRVEYQWQVVPSESVFAPFSQDDFLFAANFRGHLASVRVRLAKGLDLRFWVMAQAVEEAAPASVRGGWQWRARLDLDLRF